MAAIPKEEKATFFIFRTTLIMDTSVTKFKVDIFDFWYFIIFHCFVFPDNFTIKAGGLLLLCIYYFCTDKTNKINVEGKVSIEFCEFKIFLSSWVFSLPGLYPSTFADLRFSWRIEFYGHSHNPMCVSTLALAAVGSYGAL